MITIYLTCTSRKQSKQPESTSPEQFLFIATNKYSYLIIHKKIKKKLTFKIYNHS